MSTAKASRKSLRNAGVGNFFSTVQVHPALGRDFRPDEDEVQGRNPVVIISSALWGRASPTIRA